MESVWEFSVSALLTRIALSTLAAVTWTFGVETNTHNTLTPKAINRINTRNKNHLGEASLALETFWNISCLRSHEKTRSTEYGWCDHDSKTPRSSHQDVKQVDLTINIISIKTLSCNSFMIFGALSTITFVALAPICCCHHILWETSPPPPLLMMITYHVIDWFFGSDLQTKVKDTYTVCTFR